VKNVQSNTLLALHFVGKNIKINTLVYGINALERKKTWKTQVWKTQKGNMNSRAFVSGLAQR
jgi:hypothetical protein